MTNPPNKIILAGGNGFCGCILARHFSALGWDVVVLSRSLHPDAVGVRYQQWDGETLYNWAQELEGADAVVNLAGRSVDCRYNERNKHEIYDSRLKSTVVLGRAIAGCAVPPPVWLNSATATIYRHAEDRPQDEATGEIGSGFSVDVAQKWEAALFDATTPTGVRKMALRSAMVMGTQQGTVFDVLTNLARKGLGGTMGSGAQRVSWIHEYDYARAVEFLIQHEELDGPVNLSAPESVSNREMMRLLREAMGIGIGLPAARWMLEIGALFLRTETELILKSRWVSPSRLLAAGFTFKYPGFKSAIEDLLARRGKVEERDRQLA